MTIDFTDRVVVVNGGANGIGAETSVWLADHGASIAILDVADAGPTVERITRAGGTAWATTCDVGRPEQIVRAFAAVDDAVGPPAVLVNNAGINPRQSPFDVDLDTWNRVLAVNLTGYFLCAREAARRMVARGGGSIVNVSSIAGSSALGRGNLAYSASKGAVDAMTRELAVEWAAAGIRVNAVAPCQVATSGFVENRTARQAAGDATAVDYRRGIPLDREADPVEIARTIGFLASDLASMITGAVLPVDGGNLAFNAGGTRGAAPPGTPNPATAEERP